jgi:hypothetical protein
MTDNLEIALAAARRGRRVFPFELGEPDGGGRRPKIPKIKWKDGATTDEAQIRRWWKTWPDAYPGWRLSDNIVVIDVDDPAKFEAAGLELDLKTASQVTPRGGYHLAYRGDGRPIRQTVAEVPGADTRVSDLGWVGLYDLDSFMGRPIKPAPEFLYGPREPQGDQEGGEREELGTREEILRWLGGIQRAQGHTKDELYGLLLGARESGHIVALDEARPWEDSDLRAIAKEASKWSQVDSGERFLESIQKFQARIGSRALNDRRVREHEDEEPGSFYTVLEDIDPTEPKPLELGFLDPDDHTILFGDGGTGKGVIASWWAAQLSRKGDVVAVLDYEAHAKYEWRPRIQAFGGDLSRVLIAQPERPIWDVAERAREDALALANGARVWLFVDSIGYACAGKPVEDSGTATLYSAAIAKIGFPTLSLAHTTKQDASPRHPFGSVFWSNGARITINVTGKEREPRKLENRKTNQRAPFQTVSYKWDWVDFGLPPALEELYVDGRLRSLELSESAEDILERLREAGREGLTQPELVAQGLNTHTVRDVLRKDLVGLVIKTGTMRKAEGSPQKAAVYVAREHYGDEPE